MDILRALTKHQSRIDQLPGYVRTRRRTAEQELTYPYVKKQRTGNANPKRATSRGRSNRKKTRSYRKDVGSVGKRKLRGRRGVRDRLKRARATLTDVLATPDNYVQNIYDLGSSSLSANGGEQPASWIFAGSNVTGVQTVWTTGDIISLLAIAQLIDPNNISNTTYTVTKDKSIQLLRNMTNMPINIRAYKCMARDHVPIGPTGAGYANPFNIMGEGWAQQGLNAANPNLNNTAINEWNKTLYQNSLFCQYFKIMKKVTYTHKAGATKRFMSTSKTPRMIRPAKLVYMTATQNYNTGQILHSYLKGETFWLFQFASTPSIQNTSGTRTIAYNTAEVTLETNLTLTYKYIIDNKAVTTTKTIGITAPVAGSNLNVQPFTGDIEVQAIA